MGAYFFGGLCFVGVSDLILATRISYDISKFVETVYTFSILCPLYFYFLLVMFSSLLLKSVKTFHVLR